MARKFERIASIAVALSASAALAACGGGERTAEAEEGGTTAEVSTNLPESQVPDQQLENAAEGAAAAAATPGAGTSVVVSPDGGSPAPAGANVSGGAAATAGAAGVTTADQAK